jgi:lipopolysaccharide export system permease protein
VRHGKSLVHVGQTFSRERAADVEVYELDESGRLRQFIAAKQALIERGQDWLLSDIQAKVFDGENIAVTSLGQYRLTSFLTPAQVSILELPPDSLSLSDLWGLIQSLRERSENAKAYALAFWQKVCLPLTTGVMVLFSLTFIFGSTRIRNAGQRIFAGMLVGVVFYLANQILGHLGLILDLPPVLTTLAPVSLILLAALRLLRKAF